MSSLEQGIFRQGGTTYYWSSKFFPKDIRDDVHRLYSFVRVVDDCIDKLPQQKARFKMLRRAWARAQDDPTFDTTVASTDTIDERVIKNIVHLQNKHALDPSWIEAFFSSMQADLEGRYYQTMDDTLEYIYGSAEVIGFMMAKIMNLSPEAYGAARMQGRAMQYINFIRDIAEDAALSRCYFPAEELQVHGVVSLQQPSTRADKIVFKKFMRAQLNRYDAWQAIANKGHDYLPKRLRIPVKTAATMYDWTAKQIAENPLAVYEQKIKPGKRRVFLTGLISTLS